MLTDVAGLYRRAHRCALYAKQRRCPRKHDFYNSEGYPDPTAYSLIKQENALEAKTNFLIKVLKFVANEAGYDVLNRIELKDRKTSRIFK